ncbi:MAG: hypothetical protein FJ276_37380 [Planctomycetes bacterium]|nr:hypothetical protein [Planctomycetota bacterium]
MLNSAFLVMATSVLLGQTDKTGIPDDAANSLGYYVGTWQGEWKENDAVHSVQFTISWERGRHCTIARGRVKGPDSEIRVTLLSGWDALNREVVDFSYGSDGSHSIERWKIASSTVEEAVSTGASGSGKPTQAIIRTEKEGPDKFTQRITGRREGDESKPDILIEFRRVKNSETPGKRKRNKDD